MKFTRKPLLASACILVSSMALADNNWGKWGQDDELGTLNYVTEHVRREAAKAVKSGSVFNLAIDLKSGQPGWPGRNFRHGFTYIYHTFTKEGGGIGASDDYAFIDLQVSTQWDGFPHIFYDGTLYNGVPSSVITAMGTQKHSIHQWADHFVTRGVLLDVARYKSVDYLEKGYVISADDLNETAAEQGVEIRSGDCLMIRTGWIMQLFEHKWPMKDQSEALEFGEPGLGYSATQWLKEKEIACVAVDNLGVEAIPFDPEAQEKVMAKPPKVYPVHVELLVNQGMPIGELFNFERLAEHSASDGQYDFLFSAPPLRVVGGVGSPLSPMALK